MKMQIWDCLRGRVEASSWDLLFCISLFEGVDRVFLGKDFQAVVPDTMSLEIFCTCSIDTGECQSDSMLTVQLVAQFRQRLDCLIGDFGFSAQVERNVGLTLGNSAVHLSLEFITLKSLENVAVLVAFGQSSYLLGVVQSTFSELNFTGSRTQLNHSGFITLIVLDGFVTHRGEGESAPIVLREAQKSTIPYPSLDLIPAAF